MNIHQNGSGARLDSGESAGVGSHHVAFWVAGATLTLFLCGASAPSPLYAIYQAKFGFSTTILTAIFAVYAVAVLAAVLPAGELSDQVGRRPVIVFGLGLQMVATALFLIANDIALLFAARILQGISVGVVIGALSALLVDLQDRGSTLGPLVASVASPLGLAIGALLGGELVEFVGSPLRTVYWVLLALFALATLAVLALVPETRSRRPGQRLALSFEVRLPPRARSPFIALTPGLIAIWALAGLYLSLGPSLTASLLGDRSIVVGALVPTTLFGATAVASVLTRGWTARLAVVGGSLLVALGVAITIVGIIERSALPLFLGSGVAGLGFGAAFAGSFRTLIPLAEPNERASLVASLYLVCYSAFSVPAVIAGIAVTHYGLRDTAVVYASVVIVLALTAALASELRRSATTRLAGSVAAAADAHQPIRPRSEEQQLEVPEVAEKPTARGVGQSRPTRNPSRVITHNSSGVEAAGGNRFEPGADPTR
jgi:MFS family permease